MDTIVKAVLLTVGMVLAAGCTGELNGSESGDCVGCLGNPASIHCEQLGYRLEIRSSDHGDTGVCVFPDGTECEEWSFFYGTC